MLRGAGRRLRAAACALAGVASLRRDHQQKHLTLPVLCLLQDDSLISSVKLGSNFWSSPSSPINYEAAPTPFIFTDSQKSHRSENVGNL